MAGLFREAWWSTPSARPSSSTSTCSTRGWTSCGCAASGRWTRCAGSRPPARRPPAASGTPSWRCTPAGCPSCASVEDRLCFGRLDLLGGERRYVGRVGLSDDEHRQLLVDWRAPAAEPFYRATAVRPAGVVRRRQLATRAPAGDQHRGRGARPRRVRPGAGRAGRGRRGRADGRARRRPHRQDARHRRHHPGRAGPGDPLAAVRHPHRPGRARAPGRPRSRCTAPRTCSTPTGTGSPRPACSWSARTSGSCATSTRCCRRSARPRRPCWSRPGRLYPGVDAVAGEDPEVAAVKGDLRMAAAADPGGPGPAEAAARAGHARRRRAYGRCCGRRTSGRRTTGPGAPASRTTQARVTFVKQLLGQLAAQLAGGAGHGPGGAGRATSPSCASPATSGASSTACGRR